MIHWFEHLNGWLQLFIIAPLVWLFVFLPIGVLVGWATEKEMARWKRKFIEKHGREPREDEWPEPPSMYP